MGARTASWGCTAGLRYAVPCETLDQMVLLRTVLNFSVLAIFLDFGLSVPPSERVVLCDSIQRNQTMWQFTLVVRTWQW